MKNTIDSIKVEGFIDESPDTSYLGEYARSAKGDYSIDRKHSLECAINNPQQTQAIVDQLNRIIAYLQTEYSSNGLVREWDDAIDVISETMDTVTECDCDDSGDWSHRELQYFNTSGNYAGEALADIVAYTKQDYARMESYNNGDWCFIGIRIEAQVTITGITERLYSGGLWGIESDNDTAHIVNVIKDETADIRSVLSDVGFSQRSINAAIKEMEVSA